MEAFVNTALAENILLDGAIDHESVELGVVGGGGWFPFGRGDYLYDIRIK